MCETFMCEQPGDYNTMHGVESGCGAVFTFIASKLIFGFGTSKSIFESLWGGVEHLKVILTILFLLNTVWQMMINIF